MAPKVNKGKRNYTYSGCPRSYWKVASKRKVSLIPKGEKESAFDKDKRLERNQRLANLERAVQQKRKVSRVQWKKNMKARG